jgi:5'-3' exonuclease
MKKLVKVDGDSLCFYSSRDTIENSIFNIKERIQTIIDKTEATHYMLCLTGSECFRYKIYPDYKANRKVNQSKYPQKLKYLKTLKSFLIEEYNALLIQELEADDLVAYNYNLLDFEQVISSPDKDVIQQLVGTHYNYGKDEFVTVTQKSGERFLAFALLCGDVSDNIKGLAEKTDYVKKTYSLDNRKGIGESTANKMLDIMDKNNQNYAAEILKCYISKYKDESVGVQIAETPTVTAYRHGKSAYEQGFEDYTLNRYLLELNTGIGRYNKILQNYDISEHINEVNKTILTNEEF